MINGEYRDVHAAQLEETARLQATSKLAWLYRDFGISFASLAHVFVRCMHWQQSPLRAVWDGWF
jgi:hypothetical protein